MTAAVQCAGNGRSYFTTQQCQTVSGTGWKLGAALGYLFDGIVRHPVVAA